MYRFMIAGESTGIGKTTIATALMAYLDNVAPFKAGPDYIDPKFHSYVTKNKSYNLDPYMLNEPELRYLFKKHSNKKYSIVEGVMGLYDGMGNDLDNFSSAHLSKILKLPVVLVLDGRKIATSLVAKLYGYINFDKDVNIVGVIINNTSKKMYEFFKEGIERHTDIKVLGWFPHDNEVKFQSRHLGLKDVDEDKEFSKKIEILKGYVERYIDIELLNEITKSNKMESNKPIIDFDLKGKHIAIAKDEAFNFYYEDNLELLVELGAKVTYFSPIKDTRLPKQVDLVYIGGGYPELFAEELSSNSSMIESLKQYAQDRGRIYGECGGFMYLTKGIKTIDNHFYPMCNILPSEIEMSSRLNISRFGYINIKNFNTRTHEFHYSKNIDNEANYLFDIHKESKGRSWKCGLNYKNVIGTYAHVHFYSNFNYLKYILGIK